MINPNLLRPKYGKLYNPKAPGGKFYMAHVGRATRKVFRTATDALLYANRLVIRWRRLYDAAVMEELVRKRRLYDALVFERERWK